MVRKLQPLESEIETYFTWNARKFGALTFKLTSPSTAGVPDRILIYHGLVCFVEIKAPGQQPRPLQIETTRRMRSYGAHCYCISTKLQVTHFLYSLLKDQGYPKEDDYDPI